MLSQRTPDCPDFWQADVWTSPAPDGKVSLHVGSLKYGGASLRAIAEVAPKRQATANFMLNLINFIINKMCVIILTKLIF